MMSNPWWKNAVVYEIYCKSFADSNGDGIGDLKGVMEKLPMLKELGVTCIWFTPIYTSPQVDNGYDVADYRNIDPAYGTLEDFQNLLQMAHSMDMKVIMDVVVNHSSDEHVWFQESRKSKDNPYRNYYIWKPAKDGKEPNNWGSYFREENGSAWKYDEATGEYYFHQYAIKMPDLNWDCKELREEIYDMLNWWIDLGVDGFRLDVFTRFQKTPGFPDTTKKAGPLDRNGFVVDHDMCTNVEGIHEIIHELNRNVFGKRGVMTVGEGSGVTYENALPYVHPDREELNMVYHFQLAARVRTSLSADQFRDIQSKWAQVIANGGWAVQYLSNHDSARQVSCYGDATNYREESAMLLATLMHTTPGTPFVYQGEEIGMTNVKFDSIEDYNCCYTKGDYYSMIQKGATPEEAISTLAPRSRDNARTPYQWNGSEHAGFTTGKPWLKVNPAYEEINLEKDLQSEKSIFRYYQKLIAMRKEHPAITEGDLKFYLCEDRDIVLYTRTCEKETLLVVANMSSKPATLTLPEELRGEKFKRILTNCAKNAPALDGRTQLQPWESEVYVKA
ncbi:MAG: alpha-glucosidase [Oscillospiraceae bacterium]|nr:alpha-glucosidase [Oscillospiraceae bacterium]